MTTTDNPTPDATSENSRNSRRTQQGVVIGTKMEKTITVRVERRYKHAKYGKFVRSHANYLVHDENSEAKEGDIVVIDSTRPISKKKRWRLSTVVTTGGLNETVVPGSDVAALLEDAQ